MKTQTQTKIQWIPKHNKESDWDGIELNDPETGITHASLDHCTPEAMALIAAAPAMLEALRGLQKAITNAPSIRVGEFSTLVGDAIAAAENLPTG